MDEAEHRRAILSEAFTAGWQAALAVRITDPRVLAVVESCFDLWLAEAGDEADVLGFVFRGREDLPVAAEARTVGGRHRSVRKVAATIAIPRQRRS